jgi:hypothetical protein
VTRARAEADGGGPLVCVYFRVAAADLDRAIQAVREFQRTLAAVDGAVAAQVLLRCAQPRDGTSPARPAVARQATADASPAASSSGAGVDPDAEHTLMETYTLAPGADAPAFLAALEAAAAAIAGLVRGARHVELFSPCAS